MQFYGNGKTVWVFADKLLFEGSAVGPKARDLPLAQVSKVAIFPASATSDGSLRFIDFDGAAEIVKFSASQQRDFQHLHDLIASRIKVVPPTPTAVICTTGLDVPGHDIAQVLEVISAECAMGMHILKDIANAWRDAVGGRSKSLQGTLREARRHVLSELKMEASSIGADAVIGVDLDYNEFSSSIVSGGMIMVVATGTAVRLSKVTLQGQTTQ